jgi:predicted regulator of Ras-like GTPase activity (Roadblock/LC7/MglB family)
MQNFSNVVALFQDLPSVLGVLIIDGDGLALAGSLNSKAEMESSSPVLHTLLNDIFRHLAVLGETTNQVCFIQDSRIIIAQPVYDVILVVYSEKTGLDLLRPRFLNAVSLLQRITAPDFSNN